MSTPEVIESPAAAERLQAAAEFLDRIPPGDEVLVVGASRSAVDDLIRFRSVASRATFGLHRYTLTQLAARLAAPALAESGLATCTRLAAEAVAARATFEALEGGRIPYFAAVARCPGFARSLAATLRELREAAIDGPALAGGPAPTGELAALLEGYEGQLAAAYLADRAVLLRAARAAADRPDRDALIGLPLVLLDVPIATRLERGLVAVLFANAPRALATVPIGDVRTRAALTAGGAPLRVTAGHEPSSLQRLQRYLFNEAEEPPAGEADDSVRFFSAPGEGREAVEIARWILAEARTGTRFDQMVVYLRRPDAYTALLETAFRRADIPAYFARGTRRPNAAGRAFLAVLACAADGLSATRFAEYLSFGQVPLGSEPPTPAQEPAWTAPRDELLGAASAVAERTELPVGDGADATPEDSDAPGRLPAPWKWEDLLVDAAVIGGGVGRWRRRLAGLAREFELQREEVVAEEPDSPRAAGLARMRDELQHLGRFALPVIERLAAFPDYARWGEWRAHLDALAPIVLRRPQSVREVLAELAPMDAVGPVGLDEVRAVLAERLTFLTDEPPKYRYGRVLVTALEDARGRTCDVAFVPGLAERILPQRPREDPLLLDPARAALSLDLTSQDERVDRERLLLRLAVGSARRRLYVSYPRVDVVQGRPRVISFYGLDVARATRGTIPGLELFEREAAALGNARLAWPAPPDPDDAIDAAEHDLAMLARLIHAPSERAVRGAAQYLIELNPHLARSLRTRFMRWNPHGKWSRFDGFVRVGDEARQAIAKHRLSARAYSPSALERFAVCPYRFFLAAIHRLEPRRTVAPLEQLDPLTRGRLFHHVQSETLRALADAGDLPFTAAGLPVAERVLGATLDRVADEYRDELAPAIARVWNDEIGAIHADLVQWLRHLAADSGQWRPLYFEFGFGLPIERGRDPHSRREEVVVDGVRLRGSVDLVERAAAASLLRVTDHKTGANRTARGLVVGGGEVLQPVLYGLAVEAALGDRVACARLSFCTERGGFTEHTLPLDDRARAAGRSVLSVIDRAIAAGFLPAAPRQDACAQCDFHLVCGPHEAERLDRKTADELADLAALRRQP